VRGDSAPVPGPGLDYRARLARDTTIGRRGGRGPWVVLTLAGRPCDGCRKARADFR